MGAALTPSVTDEKPSASNLARATPLVRSIFAELAAQSQVEEAQYQCSGHQASAQKKNKWYAYIGAERVDSHIARSLRLLQCYPDFQVRPLSEEELRFLVLLQHFVAEDTVDIKRPEAERHHNDVFEGILTDSGVNSQLVKDAHRAEWSIEGTSFLMPEKEHESSMEDRKRVIAEFSRTLIIALESFLLSFAQRRGLSEEGTQHLLRATTTQMSQCGLANLDRCSKAGKYFVSGKGLDQQLNYNISLMEAGPWGEALKLSLLCMKTGFGYYQRADTLGMQDENDEGEEAGPQSCSPSSYLYQYATLRFTTVPAVEGEERIECIVIDALDEARIDPAES